MGVRLVFVCLLPGAAPGELEKGQPSQPSPFPPAPKALSLLAFPIPDHQPNRGASAPFLLGKGGFSALVRAGKAFLAAHGHLHPLFPMLRPPGISPRPLLEYVPFGEGV